MQRMRGGVARHLPLSLFHPLKPPPETSLSEIPSIEKTLINKLEEAKRNLFSRDHNNGLQHAIDIIRELKERK